MKKEDFYISTVARFLNLDLETNRFLNKSFFSKLKRQKRLVDPPLKFFFL